MVFEPSLLDDLALLDSLAPTMPEAVLPAPFIVPAVVINLATPAIFVAVLKLAFVEAALLLDVATDSVGARDHTRDFVVFIVVDGRAYLSED